ncbi:MAG: 1-phosphofructokinase family hexose kinase [Bacteroidia bacterium]
MSHDIITITLAPCIDKSTVVEKFVPEKKLKCTYPLYEAGGGGINVSRALRNFNLNSLCVFISGGYTGVLLNQMIHHLHIPYVSVPSRHYTRENFIVFENQTHLQFRFGMPVNPCQPQEWKQVLNEIANSNPKFIVLSGSINEDISPDFYSKLYQLVKRNNAKLIVDSAGKPLKQIIKSGAFLIKPNQTEFSQLFGSKQLTIPQLKAQAKAIINRKKIENIIISLGDKGALFVSIEKSIHFMPPKLIVKSTVGAGDTMVAGIIYSLMNNEPIEEACKFGVASGSATIINKGMQLGTLKDAKKIHKLISQKEL